MWFDYLLKNILIFFLPVAIPSTIALLAIEKFRKRIQLIILGNIFIFIIIVLYTIISFPKPDPLIAEVAFYALEKKPAGGYLIRNLLGESSSSYLGLEKSLEQIEHLPIVNSGEGIQMRIKASHIRV